MSNNILKKIQDGLEPELNKLITTLMSNEKFTSALEKVVSQTLKAKDGLDSSVKKVLASMNITTKKDLEKVASKADHALKQVEKVAKDFEKKIEKGVDEAVSKARGLVKDYGPSKAKPAAAKPKAAPKAKKAAAAKPKAAAKKAPAKKAAK